MNYEKIMTEQERHSGAVDNYMAGSITMLIILVLLYISGIAHAAVRIGYENIDANRITRIIMLIVAIFAFPLYWIVYPIVYLSGGFKK